MADRAERRRVWDSTDSVQGRLVGEETPPEQEGLAKKSGGDQAEEEGGSFDRELPCSRVESLELNELEKAKQ